MKIIKQSVQKLLKPFVGKYFKSLDTGSYEYEWFYIVDIPRSKWSIYSPVLGCDFDVYSIPVKFMQLDGMLKEGSISISSKDFQDNGTKMFCSIVEITADEWFDELKRRIQEDVDRRSNQLKNNKR